MQRLAATSYLPTITSNWASTCSSPGRLRRQVCCSLKISQIAMPDQGPVGLKWPFSIRQGRCHRVDFLIARAGEDRQARIPRKAGVGLAQTAKQKHGTLARCNALRETAVATQAEPV